MLDNWTEDGCNEVHLMEGLEKIVTRSEVEEGCELSKEMVDEIEKARSQSLKWADVKRRKKKRLLGVLLWWKGREGRSKMEHLCYNEL
jgi:hypothetical protein